VNPPMEPLPPEYLTQHIQDALAADPRARELGVDTHIVGTRVVLTGVVATADQRSAIGEVVREVVDREPCSVQDVVNELAVMPRGDDGPAEELA
jgi:osmotically-inducible protein OsmY